MSIDPEEQVWWHLPSTTENISGVKSARRGSDGYEHRKRISTSVLWSPRSSSPLFVHVHMLLAERAMNLYGLLRADIPAALSNLVSCTLADLDRGYWVVRAPATQYTKSVNCLYRKIAFLWTAQETHPLDTPTTWVRESAKWIEGFGRWKIALVVGGGSYIRNLQVLGDNRG